MKKKTTAKKRKYTKRATPKPEAKAAAPTNIDQLEGILDAALDACRAEGEIAMVAVIFDRKNMNKNGHYGAIRVGTACNTQEMALAAQYIGANAQQNIMSVCRPRNATVMKGSLTEHLLGLAEKAN